MVTVCSLSLCLSLSLSLSLVLSLTDCVLLGWTRFETFLRHMLQAVSHLIAHNMVHGDIKLDQFFMDRHQQTGQDLLVLALLLHASLCCSRSSYSHSIMRLLDLSRC